ncbi:hypothetical protein [Bacillus velezensis]|nr:hypothetical protein [Bacillus velezensis]
MTNQDGFDYLDQLKDADGKYLLKDILLNRQTKCYLAVG